MKSNLLSADNVLYNIKQIMLEQLLHDVGRAIYYDNKGMNIYETPFHNIKEIYDFLKENGYSASVRSDGQSVRVDLDPIRIINSNEKLKKIYSTITDCLDFNYCPGKPFVVVKQENLSEFSDNDIEVCLSFAKIGFEKLTTGDYAVWRKE